MPNGHGDKEYGKHKYSDGAGTTSDCKYGCGCWMGPSRSGGPTGLDPFGKCPNNPKNTKRSEGITDYDNVVTQRIKELESRACIAEEKLKKVKPSKQAIANELDSVKKQLSGAMQVLSQIRDVLARARLKD
jgi:hypothetical protein